MRIFTPLALLIITLMPLAIASDTQDVHTERKGEAGLRRLHAHSAALISHSKALYKRASTSHSSISSSTMFQRDAAVELTAFYEAIYSFTGSLEDLPCDQDPLPLWTDVLNSVKFSLTSVDTILHNIPPLRPILGPIVYDISYALHDLRYQTPEVDKVSFLIRRASSIVCSVIVPPPTALCVTA